MSIVGCFGLTAIVFEQWKDKDLFRKDLEDACHILGLRTGLVFEIDETRFINTHTTWVRTCDEWLKHLLPGSSTISHLKKAAILLDRMCEFLPISVKEGPAAEKVQPPGPQDAAGYPSIPQLPAGEIRKFKDGGCHYFAWLLAYHVCEYFERHRTDRMDTYESRITDDFEGDMVSSLLSGKVSAQGLHMTLEALFLRD